MDDGRWLCLSISLGALALRHGLRGSFASQPMSVVPLSPSRQRPLRFRSPRGFIVGFDGHAVKRLRERAVDPEPIVRFLDRFEPDEHRTGRLTRRTDDGVVVVAYRAPGPGWTVLTVYRDVGRRAAPKFVGSKVRTAIKVPRYEGPKLRASIYVERPLGRAPVIYLSAVIHKSNDSIEHVDLYHVGIAGFPSVSDLKSKAELMSVAYGGLGIIYSIADRQVDAHLSAAEGSGIPLRFSNGGFSGAWSLQWLDVVSYPERPEWKPFSSKMIGSSGPFRTDTEFLEVQGIPYESVPKVDLSGSPIRTIKAEQLPVVTLTKVPGFIIKASGWRNFKYRNEVPAKVLKDFEWTNEEDHFDGWGHRKDDWFHRSEFTRTEGLLKQAGWDGYESQSYSSGLLLKLSEDGERYKIAYFYTVSS
jgi:hypothetical protein